MINPQLLDLMMSGGIPLLGICYGMQLIVHFFGGKIEPSRHSEFGSAELEITRKESPLVKKMSAKNIVWMSHGDRVSKLPSCLEAIAQTKDCAFAGVVHKEKQIYGIQFHPEVAHSREGSTLLKNFCEHSRLEQSWTMKNYAREMIGEIQRTVGKERVLLGLSGGVDSMVTAKLISQAVPSQLSCVYVDNGLMRSGETGEVSSAFQEFLDIPLHVVRAEKIFLKALKGVHDPEKKRKIIGRTFIDEFKKKIQALGEHRFLAQGTLYPDVIESVSVKGPSDVIKSHHNRVKEVLELLREGKVIEPLKELFKDEVRQLGRELGMPDQVLMRHPFPGPGLAIRILGEISREKINILRQADQIFINGLKKARLYDKVWQAFAVLLPVKSVGVMGDQRTYQNVVVLRAVESKDGMTADFAKLPLDFLSRISTQIINQVEGVNRVVYDTSSKPPATIEWE